MLGGKILERSRKRKSGKMQKNERKKQPTRDIYEHTLHKLNTVNEQ